MQQTILIFCKFKQYTQDNAVFQYVTSTTLLPSTEFIYLQKATGVFFPNEAVKQFATANFKNLQKQKSNIQKRNYFPEVIWIINDLDP